MSTAPRTQRNPLATPTAVIRVAAIGLAAFMGLVASGLYGGHEERPVTLLFLRVELTATIGTVWGALTGLIAATLWCRGVFRAVARGQHERLIGRGAVLGGGAGLLSAILLHLGLVVTTLIRHGLPPELNSETLVIAAIGIPMIFTLGGVCGIIPGLILGALGGALCRTAVLRAAPPPAPHDTTPGGPVS